MSYNLTDSKSKNTSAISRLREAVLTFTQFLEGEKAKLVIVGLSVLVNTASTTLTPLLIAQAIDQYISRGDLSGLGNIITLLLLLYLAAVIAGYLQARIMGRVSLRTLYRLREALFGKIQNLPIAFFNQNKTGDLISRLNNDTDKLNQFLSETLLRSVSVIFSVLGIGVIIFFLNVQMALVTVGATLVLALATWLLSPWVERVNKKSLQSAGDFSAEVQESLNNYKAIIAFNRQSYFRERLGAINEQNYRNTYIAQVASGLFNPIYNFAGNIAQIFVLAFGIYLISQGQLSVGLLIGFITYTQKFYEPLRILGTVWGTLQSALAAWFRVQEILELESNLKVIKN